MSMELEFNKMANIDLETLADRLKNGYIGFTVQNIRYWDALEMYIGETVQDYTQHPKGSTIAFKEYTHTTSKHATAIKPLSDYENTTFKRE